MSIARTVRPFMILLPTRWVTLRVFSYNVITKSDLPISCGDLKAQYIAMKQHGQRHDVHDGSGVASAVKWALTGLHIGGPVQDVTLVMPLLPVAEAKKLCNVLIAWMLAVSPAERACAKCLLE